MTALPEGLTPGTWNLDPTHTSVGFMIRHAGISKVRGTFKEVSGSLIVGETLEETSFNAEAKIDSINTGVADRDNHLKSDDFFSSSTHPTITFRSTEFTGDTLTGELTIKGVTKTVKFDVDFEGAATDPFGTYRAGFSGSTKVSRKDFGITWNAALETGGVLVGDEVKIGIEAEFVAPAAA